MNWCLDAGEGKENGLTKVLAMDAIASLIEVEFLPLSSRKARDGLGSEILSLPSLEGAELFPV